jgi:hypothetical protein
LGAADWWLGLLPESMVAYWDFNDPAIPNTETDTAATAVASSALLKLSELAPSADLRARYRDAGERTIKALVDYYLTPLSRGESRPSGMLIGACFNKRRDARSQGSATNVETIFGSYYLFEALNVRFRQTTSSSMQFSQLSIQEFSRDAISWRGLSRSVSGGAHTVQRLRGSRPGRAAACARLHD